MIDPPSTYPCSQSGKKTNTDKFDKLSQNLAWVCLVGIKLNQDRFNDVITTNYIILSFLFQTIFPMSGQTFLSKKFKEAGSMCIPRAEFR